MTQNILERDHIPRSLVKAGSEGMLRYPLLDEVTRNLVNKWNMEPAKACRREEKIRRHFPEAWVDGFEPLIEVMTNDTPCCALRKSAVCKLPCPLRHCFEPIDPRGCEHHGIPYRYTRHWCHEHSRDVKCFGPLLRPSPRSAA